MKLNGSTIEQHFTLCVLLTVFFFACDQAWDLLLAFKLISDNVGGKTAHEAFLMFSGVAVGIFRGMLPSNNNNEPKV